MSLITFSKVFLLYLYMSYVLNFLKNYTLTLIGKSQQCLSDMSWRFSTNIKADDSKLPSEGRGRRMAQHPGYGEGTNAAERTPVYVYKQHSHHWAPSFQLAFVTCDSLNRGCSEVSLCSVLPWVRAVLSWAMHRGSISPRGERLAVMEQPNWPADNGRANCRWAISCHYSRPGWLLMTGLLAISLGGIIYLEIITLNFFSENYLIPTFN